MSMRLAFALLCATSALSSNACTNAPQNGSTVVGTVYKKKLTFSGYYAAPSAPIRLEVMTSPTLDPAKPESWAPFAEATTGTSPLYVNSDDPLYAWSVEAAPVNAPNQVARWPQGGLLRVRAIHPGPDGDFQLVTFDQVTFDGCLNQQLAQDEDWITIGQECAGAGNRTAALVSTTDVPVLPGGPDQFSVDGFLGRKGKIEQGETEQYYFATNAPLTLNAFKNKYGFPGDEVTATYYNDGDLGLGREMHCKKFTTTLFLTGIACYVTNYSGTFNADDGKGVADFGVDPNIVLSHAVTRQHAFATVAMTYEPLAATNAVKFVVYNANGVRANTAQLDSTSNNTSIPNNCLSCHGINSTYDKDTLTVSADARFLPFDPYSFKFASTSGFSFADQIGEIRRLNQLITLTNPTPAIDEFITGLYAPKSVNDPTAVSNDDYVPADWAQATPSLSGTAAYRGLVKVACRTCHMSATDPTLDFADYADFLAKLPSIKADVCGPSHVMPHAERVMQNFWNSGARAYLVTAFPATSYPDPLAACKP
jgi:hypothetical protein